MVQTINYAYLDDIEAIAEGNSTASFIAKNILGLKNDTIYEEILLTKDQQRLGEFEPVDEKNNSTQAITEKEQHDYRLKPNLFNGKLLANITLLDDEEGYVELYSIEGGFIGKIKLLSGKNDLDLTPLNIPNGIYIYRVWANNAIRHHDKFVKIK